MIEKKRSVSIAVTLGDPAGIGPEVTAMALRRLKLAPYTSVHIFGPAYIWDRYCRRVGLKRKFTLHDTGGKAITPGHPDHLSSLSALQALEAAVAALKNGLCQALVTAPVSKDKINQTIEAFTGHTEYLAEAFSSQRPPEMMFVAGTYRVVLATRHIPLAAVRRELTTRRLQQVTQTVLWSLTHWFGKAAPQLAFCGLNPHAGEEGRIGQEEETILKPFLRRHPNASQLHGPYAADTLFIPTRWRCYDAVIAMYHDQGLTPMKSLFFNKAVNLTLGLPFVRTSPAHGTAYDLAGRMCADPGSMAAAIKLAVRLAHRATSCPS